MKPNDLQNSSPWTLARRAEKMNPSVIREILKVTEKPGPADADAQAAASQAGG